MWVVNENIKKTIYNEVDRQHRSSVKYLFKYILLIEWRCSASMELCQKKNILRD